MRAVNATGQKVLDILTKELTNKNRSREIGNVPAFMTVHVERIGKVKLGDLFMVAHFYTQNGDLMSDPEMIFLKAKTDNKYYPIYYRMNGFPSTDRYSVIFEDGKIKSYYKKFQKDDAVFAGIWMKNIKEQQEL